MSLRKGSSRGTLAYKLAQVSVVPHRRSERCWPGEWRKYTYVWFRHPGPGRCATAVFLCTLSDLLPAGPAAAERAQRAWSVDLPVVHRETAGLQARRELHTCWWGELLPSVSSGTPASQAAPPVCAAWPLVASPAHRGVSSLAEPLLQTRCACRHASCCAGRPRKPGQM